MAGDTLIDAYLAELDDRLGRVPDRRSVLDEVADHLWEKVDRLAAAGRPRAEAQRVALTEFGDPDLVGTAFASQAHGGAAVPTTTSKGFGWAATIGGGMWVLAGLAIMTMTAADGGALWALFTVAFLSGFLGLLMLGAGVHVRAGSPSTGWVGLALLAVPLAGYFLGGEIWWGVTGSLAGVAVLVFGLGARKVVWPLLALLGMEALVITDLLLGLDDADWFLLAAGAVTLLNGAALFFAGRWLATETPIDQPDDMATA